MQHKHFITKREYWAFRQVWNRSVNAKKAKARVVPHNEFLAKKQGQILDLKTADNSSYYISKNTGHHTETGWINAEHHILYNILLNNEISKGFILTITKKNCNKESAMFNFYYSLTNLVRIIKYAELILKDQNIKNKLPEPEVNGITNYNEWNTWRDNKPKDQLQLSDLKLKNKKVDKFLEPLIGGMTKEILVRIDKDWLNSYLLFNEIRKFK